MRREQRGEPAAPLDLSAGDEGRWRRAVHRVVSVSSFGRRPIARQYRYAGKKFAWRPIRVCQVHVELWESPSFRAAGCRQGVRLMPGLFCVLRDLTRILAKRRFEWRCNCLARPSLSFCRYELGRGRN